MTAFPDDTAVKRYTQRFLDLSLPQAQWTHEGHFAVALWLLRNRPRLTGSDGMRGLIMRYNDATGKPNNDSEGYHHTITRASMRAAASYLAECTACEPVANVLRSLMESDCGRPDWLLRFWRRETLFSTGARRSWIEPDLVPLPF